ncbi:MAG: lytic murein transglycosylase [Patescibacteria group bacterium]
MIIGGIQLMKAILMYLVPVSIIFVAPPVSSPSASPTPTSIVSPIEDVRLAYVQRQLINSGFEEEKVNQILTDSRREILPEKSVAYRAPNWTLIKRKIYAPGFVLRGKDFIAANPEAFDNMRESGVPKEIVAGIIAIETEFGKNTGNTPTFNAIYSRLNHKKSTENWRLEAERLAALSKYCLRSNLDCYNIKGSYAGAMGIVQFMPDSLMDYGVDGNGDAFVDLQNPEDAVPSAANFLIAHGWKQDQYKALTRYYGNPVGYPEIVLHYATLLAR